MQALIWIISVLFGFFCSLCWTAGMFLLALPAALRWPIVVDIMPLSLVVSFAFLAIWVAGLLMMWKIVIWFTERLVSWLNPTDNEKKKKRPPLD
jgi:hypothetical protein